MIDLVVELNSNRYNILPNSALGLVWEYSIQAIGKLRWDNQHFVSSCNIEIGVVNTLSVNTIPAIIRNYCAVNSDFGSVPYSELVMDQTNGKAVAIPYRLVSNYCIHSDDNGWYGSAGCIVIPKEKMDELLELTRQMKALYIENTKVGNGGNDKHDLLIRVKLKYIA